MAFIPWDKVRMWSSTTPIDNQDTIDSLEKEVEASKMLYMQNQAFMAELYDSLSTLSIIIENSQENYRKLKRQNEKLQKEKAALINNFTDDDIERYLSNRYGK
jgi:chromosome segregation ATPase